MMTSGTLDDWEDEPLPPSVEKALRRYLRRQMYPLDLYRAYTIENWSDASAPRNVRFKIGLRIGRKRFTLVNIKSRRYKW
jgi:hypothetical protein